VLLKKGAVNDVIKRAHEMGSRAQTFRGAAKYILARVQPRTPHWATEKTRGIHFRRQWQKNRQLRRAGIICSSLGLRTREEAHKIVQPIPITPKLKREIRRRAGHPGSPWPIIVTASDYPPRLEGHGYSFRWLGKYKTYPGSYTHSTHRITVGEEWLRDKSVEKSIYHVIQHLQDATPAEEAWF